MTSPPVGSTGRWARRGGAPAAVAAGLAAACAAVWLGDPTTPGGYLPVCPTKLLTGIDCPGCGGLRMLYCLLHGDLGGALRFNAVALAAVALLGWTYLVWTYGRLTRRRIVGWQRRRWAAPVTLVVISVWLVVRNLPFEPFVSLRV